jgi:CHAD domain-containing protein
MAYRLKRKESAAEAVRRVAREEIAKGIDAAGGTAPLSERVHDARTSCKKLRGLLRLVRPQLGDVYRRENVFLRDAARSLAAARDEAVILDTFDGLIRRGARHVDPDAVAAIRAALHPPAPPPSDGDFAGLLTAFADSFRDLRDRIDDWRVEDGGFAAIKDGLKDVYRRGRKAMRKAFKTDDPADFHEWRKQAKYHWYHVRLLRNVWRPVTEARAGELERLSDLLGEDHDLTVLAAAVRELTGCDPHHTKAILDLIDRRAAKLRSEAEPLGRRLYAEKPKRFVRRFRSYWKTWRGTR